MLLSWIILRARRKKHDTLLQTDQKRCNRMGIPVILEASLLLHPAAVAPSLQSADRIRHHINTAEETVRLNRFTEKHWRRA